MAEKFPGLTVAYIGSNAAHRAYRASLANAKALAYILNQNKSAVLTDFLAGAQKFKRESATGDFAIGMVCGDATPTSVRSLLLTGTEINLIEKEPGGFASQALGLIYREVHRVFETYLIDLFGEIGTADKRVLYSEKTIAHKDALLAEDPAALQKLIIEQRKSDLTRVGFAEIEKTFEKLGLPIVTGHTPRSSDGAG